MGLFNPGNEMLEIGIHTLQTISIGLFVVGPAIIGATTFQTIGRGFCGACTILYAPDDSADSISLSVWRDLGALCCLVCLPGI